MDYEVTFSVPDYVYERIQTIADKTRQSFDQVLRQHLLESFALPLPTLEPEEEAELSALAQLSDDALLTIAREQMPEALQARMQALMDLNNLGPITSDEYQELEKLVERGQRLMLRKAEADVILRRRGHKLMSKDLHPNAG